MRTLATPHGTSGRTSRPHDVVSVLNRVGRFTLHLLEMCMVMCAGAIVLSVLFFGAAGLLGYRNLPDTAPELAVLVIAVNLSLPMAIWMRYRGMAWQPTLEMSGSTMVFGLVLIAACWLDLVPRRDWWRFRPVSRVRSCSASCSSDLASTQATRRTTAPAGAGPPAGPWKPGKARLTPPTRPCSLQPTVRKPRHTTVRRLVRTSHTRQTPRTQNRPHPRNASDVVHHR
jgi:hypothetical protein